jgi:hypothetical protein
LPPAACVNYDAALWLQTQTARARCLNQRFSGQETTTLPSCGGTVSVCSASLPPAPQALLL